MAGKVSNIAQGRSTTILGLWEELARIAGSELEPFFTSPRPGDVRSSLASIDRAAADLGFRAGVDVPDGVERFWTWMSGA